MNFVLFEDYSPSCQVDSQNLVSLTPRASFLLDQHGQAFHVLESLADEHDVSMMEDVYLKNQLRWFAALDFFIKQPGLAPLDAKINWVSALYWRLKYCVDGCFLRSFAFERFLERTRPSHITYVFRKRPPHDPVSLWDLNRSDLSSYAPIIAAHCRQRNIPLSMCDIDEGVESQVRSVRKFVLNAIPPLFRNKIKNVLRLMTGQRAPFCCPSSPENLVGKSVLFLDSGCENIDILIQACAQLHAKVYCLQGNEVSRLGRLSFEDGFGLSRPVGRQGFWDPDWESRLLKELHASLRFKYLPAELHATVLFPYLKFFISKMLPEADAFYERWRSFFDEHEIDYVIARAASTPAIVAALVAAQQAKVNRVCFQHGYLPIRRKGEFMENMRLFDSVYVGSKLHELNYVTARTDPEMGAAHCEVRISSHYLSKIARKFPFRRSMKRKTILYIIKRFSGGGRIVRAMNNRIMPINIYYQFQKRLMALFKNHPSIHFIYKYSKGQDHFEQSFLPLWRAGALGNVEFAHKHSTCYFDRASAVLLDWPSTGFYESAAAGLPVFSVFPDYFQLAPTKADPFGRSLQSYSDIDDAIVKMDAFLRADWNEYRVHLDLSDEHNFIKDFCSRKPSK